MKKLSLAHAFLAALFFVMPHVSHAQEVKIYGTIDANFNYMQDGKYVGTTVETVEALRSALGVTTPIEVVPGLRASEHVEHDPNVMVFSYGRNPEREKAGLHFIGPLATRTQMLWKKKGSPITVSSLADVKSQNLTVGAVLSDARSKMLKDAGVNVEDVARQVLNVKKLAADRIPLMVSSNMEMPAVAKEAEVNIADLEPALSIAETSSYLMFSKDTDQATLDKWQAAYLALQKTDFFTKAADKWKPVLGASLTFKPEKGFYLP